MVHRRYSARTIWKSSLVKRERTWASRRRFLQRPAVAWPQSFRIGGFWRMKDLDTAFPEPTLSLPAGTVIDKLPAFLRSARYRAVRGGSTERWTQLYALCGSFTNVTISQIQRHLEVPEDYGDSLVIEATQALECSERLQWLSAGLMAL